MPRNKKVNASGINDYVSDNTSSVVTNNTALSFEQQKELLMLQAQLKREEDERIAQHKREEDERIVQLKREEDERIAQHKREEDERIAQFKREEDELIAQRKREEYERIVQLKREEDERIAQRKREDERIAQFKREELQMQIELAKCKIIIIGKNMLMKGKIEQITLMWLMLVNACISLMKILLMNTLKCLKKWLQQKDDHKINGVL